MGEIYVARTANGLRLAKSIETAPPIDWPYKICERGVKVGVRLVPMDIALPLGLVKVLGVT